MTVSKLLVGFCLGLISTFSYAVNVAQVKQISVSSSTGGGYIVFSENVTSIDCGGAPTYNYLAFDTNTVGERSVYSAALTAYATGKTVYVTAKGSCASWQSNVEEIESLMLQ